MTPDRPVPAAAPRLSVVMPVHDAGTFLHLSIESILTQTFEDFELVILDDGSTDGSREVARDWARRDGRIRLVEGARRLGAVGSSNTVVSLAQAPLCARMDADDVAHPDRLRRQWDVLAAHRDACLIGTLWDGIDERGRAVRPRDRWRLLRRSPFAPFPHGSIMFRREEFDAVGGYRASAAHWEDLDLFHRLGVRGRILVVPEVLYHYRFHGGSSRLTASETSLDLAIGLMRRCMSARARGEDYRPLLERPETSCRPYAAGHLHALVSAGSTRLWAGRRPVLFSRLWRLWHPRHPRHLRRLWRLRSLRAVPPPGLALQALVLGTWGDLSPATLRWVLRAFLRARDAVAGLALRDGSPVEWRFP